MSAKSSVPNSSSEWQSTCSGILCGALAAILVQQADERQLLFTPLLLIMILTLAANLSGFAVAIVRPSLLEKPARAIGIGCRLGLKAGWRTALTAGAMLCVLSTLNALAAPNSTTENFLKSRMWLTCCVSLAALLPSVFCGFIGGAMGARLVRSRIPPGLDSRSSSTTTYYRWPFRFLSWLSFLLLASPLVFLGREPKIDPPPVVVAKPVPVQAPVPPPFRYEVPEELCESRFNQFRVDFVKTIENAADSKAMSLSPDGRLFAYCSQGNGNSSITVFDLHTFKAVAHFIVPSHPTDSLVWSPDMKRLACSCSGQSSSASLWILSLENGLAVELPRPPETDVPLGEFFWWSAEELAFFPFDEDPLIFHLDTLTFAPVGETKYLSDKSEEAKKRWTEGPRFELPTSKHWRFEIATGLQSHQPPSRKKLDATWQWSQKFFCSFADPLSPRHHLLTDLPVNKGMKVFCAPDGSKIIRSMNGHIEVVIYRCI